LAVRLNGCLDCVDGVIHAHFTYAPGDVPAVRVGDAVLEGLHGEGESTPSDIDTDNLERVSGFSLSISEARQQNVSKTTNFVAAFGLVSVIFPPVHIDHYKRVTLVV
jgi:hypothetical protein